MAGKGQSYKRFIEVVNDAHSAKREVTIKTIAREAQIGESYISALLSALKGNGVSVTSTRIGRGRLKYRFLDRIVVRDLSPIITGPAQDFKSMKKRVAIQKLDKILNIPPVMDSVTRVELEQIHRLFENIAMHLVAHGKLMNLIEEQLSIVASQTMKTKVESHNAEPKEA